MYGNPRQLAGERGRMMGAAHRSRNPAGRDVGGREVAPTDNAELPRSQPPLVASTARADDNAGTVPTAYAGETTCSCVKGVFTMHGKHSSSQMSIPYVLSVLVALTCCRVGQTWAEAPQDLKFSKRCLMISPNEGFAVVDVNQDKSLDIVAGTHWFAGPDFIPRPLRDVDEMGEYLSQNGDHPYDVDGDGWMDIISMGWNDPELRWFKNPGAAKLIKGLKWEKHVLKVTRGQNECLALKDLDDDGVPEIYVSCWDKKVPQVVWKLGKGTDGQPSAEQILIGAEGGGHGFGFGDINGDKRDDIVCELGWYERPEEKPFAGPWKFHPDAALPHPSCPVLILDLNRDGRNDILWGKAHDFGLYWWEQGPPKADGTRTWNEHLIDNSWSQRTALPGRT